MVMNSCPFEEMVQLSPGEDPRPLREAAVVGAQGQTHDGKVNVCLHEVLTGGDWVLGALTQRGICRQICPKFGFLLTRLPLSTIQGLNPAEAEPEPLQFSGYICSSENPKWSVLVLGTFWEPRAFWVYNTSRVSIFVYSKLRFA